MLNLDLYFDDFDQLHNQLIEALMQNDSKRVEILVVEQCRWIGNLPAGALVAEYKLRLQNIKHCIEVQQAMIQQAVGVADFFLSKLYRQPSFTGLA